MLTVSLQIRILVDLSHYDQMAGQPEVFCMRHGFTPLYYLSKTILILELEITENKTKISNEHSQINLFAFNCTNIY